MAETNSLLNCRIRKGTGGSNPPFSAQSFINGVWRSPVSVPALGAGGRKFESYYPDIC